MTLGFSTHWPKQMPEQLAGKENCFVEKILEGLKQNEIINDFQFKISQEAYLDNILNRYVLYQDAKLHTIREDKTGLWKAENKIHFVINNRTPQRFQFAPVIRCVSIQKIQISHYSKKMYHETAPIVQVDDFRLKSEEIDQLAKNDGFNSVEDFFAWFNKDFTGKIIHWTNLKY